MERVDRRVLAAGAVLVLATLRPAAQEPGTVAEVPIVVRIELANLPAGAAPPDPAQAIVTVPGVPVRIKGVTLPGLRGEQLSLTITSPQTQQLPDPSQAPGEIPSGCSRVLVVGPFRAEPPHVLTIVVGEDGAFDTTFTPTTTGDHEVEIVDASGRYRGEGSFSVENLQDVADALCEQLNKEVEELVKQAQAVFREVQARLREQPPSPGRDEAVRMADRLGQEMAREFPEGEPAVWTRGAEHLAHLMALAPETAAATSRLLRDIRTWRRDAETARRKAPQALAALTRGNILCDNLDTIVNGLKFTDFMLGLLVKPGQFFVDWAVENTPTKLVSMVPPVRRTPALQEGIESAWKGVLTFKPWQRAPVPLTAAERAAGQAGRLSELVDHKVERQMGVQKMAVDLSAYVASRVMEVYCQQFRGPVSGTTRASFLAADGSTWWSYRVDISGELVLRYPKDAKGDVIALTGDIIGNGTRFRSQDNALPHLFPGLGASTITAYTQRTEPMGLADVQVLNDSPVLAGAAIAGQPVPSFNPLLSVIEKGGQVTKMLFTPAFFKVPVRGDLRGDTVRITLQDAVQDFEGSAQTNVRRLTIPVLTLGMPHWVSYALPYRGARLLLFRAFEDGPVELRVRRQATAMVLERTFHRERRTAETHGVYDVTVKACNPTCQ
ncbi:MAG: hypothetical protein R2708_02255 [Vicinamibacterales bacterium]